MSLFIALMVGIVTGVAGGFVVLHNLDYLLFNILAGLIGAILGLAFYVLANTGTSGALFSWGGTILSLLGAVVVELLYLFVQSVSKKKSESIKQD